VAEADSEFIEASIYEGSTIELASPYKKLGANMLILTRRVG